jgi:hypothetical protein
MLSLRLVFCVQRSPNRCCHKNVVFWDVAPCRSCVNRRFGGTYHLHLQGRKIRERGTSMSRWPADWAQSTLPNRRTVFFLLHKVRNYINCSSRLCSTFRRENGFVRMGMAVFVPRGKSDSPVTRQREAPGTQSTGSVGSACIIHKLRHSTKCQLTR